MIASTLVQGWSDASNPGRESVCTGKQGPERLQISASERLAVGQTLQTGRGYSSQYMHINSFTVIMSRVLAASELSVIIGFTLALLLQ